MDFDIVDDNSIANVKSVVQEYKNLFEEAKSLGATDAGSDPAQMRRGLVDRATQLNQNLISYAQQFIDYRRESNTNIQKIEEELQRAIELTGQLEEKRKRVDDLIRAIETASGKAGVAANAKHYKEARDEHAAKAKSWLDLGVQLLVGLVVFVVIAALLFLCFKKGAAFTLGYPEIASALIIVALIYAISFCNKNFQAEKHNETVNAYKDRSLTTFSSFVEAAGDDAVRDQVLLSACAAIFANPATAFSKDQGLPLPLPAVEAAKQVTRTVKG